MLSSSATLESRLHAQERKVDERKRAVVKRKDDLADEQRRALQAEAETMEVAKEIETLELALKERRRHIEGRLAALNREEEAVTLIEARAVDDMRAAEEKHQNALLEIEAGDRRIQEAIAAHEAHVTAEQARVRRQVAEAEGRHTALREKQRQILDREGALASRERQLDLSAATVRSLDKQALERMMQELKQREELLDGHRKESALAAQNSPRRN